MRRLMLSCALALGLSQPSGAADLGAPPVPVPVAPAWSWTGFYLGAHGGYGTASLGDSNGWFAGGQIGFNYQFANRWVFGVELDSAFADIGDSVSQTIGGVVVTVGSNIDYMGSARVRVGYGWDRVLVYATGGGAWVSNEITASATAGGATLTLSDAQTHFGWTAGGGVEMGFWGNVTAKVEYLYADYQPETYFANTAPLTISGDIQTHTIKLGLNYLFH
jgi:outer membrane immunogenic protein